MDSDANFLASLRANEAAPYNTKEKVQNVQTKQIVQTEAAKKPAGEKPTELVNSSTPKPVQSVEATKENAPKQQHPVQKAKPSTPQSRDKSREAIKQILEHGVERKDGPPMPKQIPKVKPKESLQQVQTESKVQDAQSAEGVPDQLKKQKKEVRPDIVDQPIPPIPDIGELPKDDSRKKFNLGTNSRGKNVTKFTIDKSVLDLIDTYFEHSCGTAKYESLSQSEKLAAYIYFTSPSDLRERIKLPHTIKMAIATTDRKKSDPYGISQLRKEVRYNQLYLQEVLCALYADVQTHEESFVDRSDITDATVDDIHRHVRNKIMPKFSQAEAHRMSLDRG